LSPAESRAVTGHTPAGGRRPCPGAYSGASYDSSFFDADAPYAAQDGGGELVELPVCRALDDWERYAFWPDVTGDGRIDRPSSVVESLREEIERCFDSPDLWVTDLDNVARWFRDRSVEKG
jgi:hypothetical protein